MIKKILPIILGAYFSLGASDYIIRQPKTSESVVKGVHVQNILSAQELNKALDTEHREQLSALIRKIKGKSTAEERLAELSNIGRLSFKYPEYAHVVDFFKDMERHMFYISKTTVNIFDQLLPSVNILHNAFILLSQLTTGEDQKIFKTLHNFFEVILFDLAWQRYREGLYFRNKGDKQEFINYITIAQALIFRLKETNPRAAKFFAKLDTYQPVPFIKEIQHLGGMAKGGGF
ncbi:MAG: hypothetical protein AB7R69_05925 [Candidatus Babeliales bacterium]